MSRPVSARRGDRAGLRLGLAVLVALVAGGCGGGSAGPMAVKDALGPSAQGFSIESPHLLDLEPGTPFPERRLAEHSPWLAAAKARGDIGDWKVDYVPDPEAPGEPWQVVRITGIRGGEVEAATFHFKQGALGHDMANIRHPTYPCAAAVFLARPADRALEADLSRLGLERRPLFGLWPEVRGALYETSRPECYAIVRADAGGVPRLAGIVRGAGGDLVRRLPGLQRWYPVKARIEEAVQSNAGLEQVKAYAEALALVPLPEDRQVARPLFDRFSGQLDRQARDLEASFAGASLPERCALAQDADSIARTASFLPEAARYRGIADRLRAETGAELDRAVAGAEAEGRAATAAGWLLLRHRLSDAAAPAPIAIGAALAATGTAPLDRARRHAAALAAAVIPAAEGPRGMDLLEPAYGGDGIFAGRALGTLLGLRTGPRADYARVAAAPAKVDVAAALGGDLRETRRTETRIHEYTVVSPRWREWKRRLDGLDAELAAALAAVDRNRGYEHETLTSGRTEVRNGVAYKVTETVVNNEMKRAYDVASDRAAELGREIAAQRALEPERRTAAVPPARYEVELQQWEGSLVRAVDVAVDGEKLDRAQRRAFATPFLRTGGSYVSRLPDPGLPEEDVQAERGWRTREDLAAETLRAFDATLAKELAAALAPVMERRLARDLERRVKAGDRVEEEAWLRYLLGVGELRPELRARLPGRALGLPGPP